MPKDSGVVGAARLAAVVVLLAAVPSAGCATLFARGPDRVQVNSNPPGARVTVDGEEVGVTPTTVVLDRQRNGGNIRIEAAGYHPITAVRAKRFNGVALLNCFNILFWGVDLISGNVHAFDTSPVNANLTPAGSPAPDPGTPYPGGPGGPPPGGPPAGDGIVK